MSANAAWMKTEPHARAETSPAADRAEFASDATRSLLGRNGLDTLEALFACRDSAEYCRRDGRCVAQAKIRDEHGSERRVFIKLHWGRRRLWPRMNDLQSGQVFQTLPVREWRGIERLDRLGLNVPERLALVQSRRWSLWFRAAVVVAAVPAPRSIDEMLADGSWNALPSADRAAILDVVVSTLSQIHAAGMGWRGASSRHYFPERRPDGTWTAWLIDCEGVHGFARRRTFRRNYERLSRSFRESGADEATLAELRKRFPA